MGRDKGLINKTHYISKFKFRIENSHALSHLNNPFLNSLSTFKGTGMKLFIATFCWINRVNLPNCVIDLCTLSTSGNAWHITGAHKHLLEGWTPPTVRLLKSTENLCDQGSLAALERRKAIKVGKGTQISFLLLSKRFLSVPGIHHYSPGSVRCAGIVISSSEISPFGWKLTGSFFTNPRCSRFSNCAPWVQ